MATDTTLAGIDELRAQLRGELITQDDDGYDEARKVYNGSIDRYPAAIARCADAADVATAIGFARAQELELAVRGGGHSGAGFGTSDGGLVIDLSAQRWVRVDPETRLVQVGGGCELGDIDHATYPYGLAIPFGTFSITGIGGLTLGGGLGHLTRKYGLSIDNLVDADVVLADGSIVKANENENAELFWALRGGGGNFGVVVEFTFQLHPVGLLLGGSLDYLLEDAPDVLPVWRDVMANAPDSLASFAQVARDAVTGEGLVNASVAWVGDLEAGREAIRELT